MVPDPRFQLRKIMLETIRSAQDSVTGPSPPSIGIIVTLSIKLPGSPETHFSVKRYQEDPFCLNDTANTLLSNPPFKNVIIFNMQPSLFQATHIDHVLNLN